LERCQARQPMAAARNGNAGPINTGSNAFGKWPARLVLRRARWASVPSQIIIDNSPELFYGESCSEQQLHWP
jgi:hypothetical protein